jgi:hypothetical protein
MGWTCEDGQHEGFFVATVATDSWRFRELSADTAAVPGGPRSGDKGQPVSVVQIACDCGWRSARLRAPAGTTWYPNTVELADGAAAFRFEAQCRELWRNHTQHHAVGQLDDGTRLDALEVAR